MNYKNTYKLLVMGGLAPIKLEVCADRHIITDKGVYIFQLKDVDIAYYPIATTIIQEIEENPDYVGVVNYNNNNPPVDMADVLAMMRANRFNG